MFKNLIFALRPSILMSQFKNQPTLLSNIKLFHPYSVQKFSLFRKEKKTHPILTLFHLYILYFLRQRMGNPSQFRAEPFRLVLTNLDSCSTIILQRERILYYTLLEKISRNSDFLVELVYFTYKESLPLAKSGSYLLN